MREFLELLEIRAFHLDQAAHLLAELDGETPPALAEEAAIELTKAGRRALSRESFRSGRKLLHRANELAPTLERRYLAARAAWRLAGYDEARSIYEEIGATSLEATLKVHTARVLMHGGELDAAERLLRDAVRVLKGLGDRAHLCEAQRSLAQLLVRRGRLDEAERLALEARESVGPEDRLSVSTTRLALGIVRFAQSREEEAQILFADALEGLRAYGMRSAERGAIEDIVELLRESGREAEAAAYAERLAELPLRSTAPIV